MSNDLALSQWRYSIRRVSLYPEPSLAPLDSISYISGFHLDSYESGQGPRSNVTKSTIPILRDTIRLSHNESLEHGAVETTRIVSPRF